MTTREFTTLPIKRKDLAKPVEGHYRVYKNSKEFVTVEAPTAQKALEASGFEKAYKVERDRIGIVNVLEQGSLKAEDEAKPAAAPEAAPAEAAPAAAAEAKETPPA